MNGGNVIKFLQLRPIVAFTIIGLVSGLIAFIIFTFSQNLFLSTSSRPQTSMTLAGFFRIALIGLTFSLLLGPALHALRISSVRRTAAFMLSFPVVWMIGLLTVLALVPFGIISSLGIVRFLCDALGETCRLRTYVPSAIVLGAVGGSVSAMIITLPVCACFPIFRNSRWIKMTAAIGAIVACVLFTVAFSKSDYLVHLPYIALNFAVPTVFGLCIGLGIKLSSNNMPVSPEGQISS